METRQEADVVADVASTLSYGPMSISTVSNP